jgi:CheY-like chemotaxis protein
MNQLVFRKMLEKWKITPVFAINGAEALSKLGNEEFDMVFMDLQMPTMNGFDATRNFRIKENKLNGSRLPIVALTADAFLESRKEVAEVGMNDFLSKPIEPMELQRVLNEYLEEA